MMKRRRFSSHSKKRAVRWFASEQTFMKRGTDYTIQTNALTPVTAILAMHARQTPATPELVELVERDTVERIRGDIVIYGDIDTACVAGLGIRVQDLLPNGTVQGYSPMDPQEGADSWMWLWHGLVAPQNAPATQFQSVTSHIDVDIKSRRVLRENQALVLHMWGDVVFPDEDTAAYHIHPYLRTLVSKPA